MSDQTTPLRESELYELGRKDKSAGLPMADTLRRFGYYVKGYEATETGLFVKGQRVCAKTDYQAQWRIGIITDVFLAPVTQQYVYVIGGEGYYASEVTDFVNVPAPQSIRVAP